MLRRDAGAQFLQALTENKIKYLLLSNFNLDEEVGKCGDIDLCIPLFEKERFITFISSYGFYERKKIAEIPGHYFYISHDASLGFYLDVQYELEFFDAKTGRKFFLKKTFEHFLQGSELVEGIYRPAPSDQFLLYLSKCVWQKKKIDSRSLRTLVQLGAAAQNFEKNDSIMGIDFCSQSDFGDGNEILAAFHREVDFSYTDFSVDKDNYAKQYSPELFVLFLGPDGAGKSSIIKGVKSLSPIKCKVLYLGLGEDGWHLPFVKAFRKIKSRIARKIGFEYFFWFVLFPFELWVRNLTAKRSGKWCVHLIDRFPGRPFIKGGGWERLYKMVLPEPDLIILLTGDPVTIAARKPTETSAARTVKEFDKWSFVAGKINCPVVRLDTTVNDIETCSLAALQEIMKIDKYRADFFIDVKRTS